MALIALILWFVTALAGLYMLAVWLIEYDVTDQHRSNSRLPVPVIFGHLLLAVSGLAVWIAYLLLDRDTLAWTAFFILLAIALLGLTMFARWIPVYRGPALQVNMADGSTVSYEMPAEGNFPLLVVLGHGMFAVTTLVLVLLTALGVGGS